MLQSQADELIIKLVKFISLSQSQTESSGDSSIYDRLSDAATQPDPTPVLHPPDTLLIPPVNTTRTLNALTQINPQSLPRSKSALSGTKQPIIATQNNKTQSEIVNEYPDDAESVIMNAIKMEKLVKVEQSKFINRLYNSYMKLKCLYL